MRFNQPVDEQLILRIAENDMDAFEELFEKTQQSIYAYALSILRNPEQSLDVCQEVFLKVRARAHRYQPMGKPLAWMFTITKNVAISQIREDGRYSEIPIEDMEGDLSLSYQADDLDTMILEKAINILTQEERSIILLHAVSGWTHREIGISLGLPLSTVLSKYHRGLKKLKKHLQNQGVNHEK